MRLEEINNPDPKYINSVIVWGLRPIACLADAMISMPERELIYLFGEMIQERCEDLEKCLLRLYGEKPGDNNQLVDIDQYQVDLIENAVSGARKERHEQPEAEESCEIIRNLEQSKAEEEAKRKSIFEDPRFMMYVAQINIDGHNPVDILESWLKEHNPEFLEND